MKRVSTTTVDCFEIIVLEGVGIHGKPFWITGRYMSGEIVDSGYHRSLAATLKAEKTLIRRSMPVVKARRKV